MNSNNPQIRPAKLKLGVFAAALLACMAVVSACDGPTNVKGTSYNSSQPFFVRALSGSPLASSSALAFPTRSVVRVDGTFAFEVAFDIDSHGLVVLLPPELVGQNPNGNTLVGIIKMKAAYDSIKEAPNTGYTVDSVTTVSVGQAVVIQAQESVCASISSAAPYLYARLVIDTVDVKGRGIWGRVFISGDCGYRQLTTGYPAF